MSWLKVWSWYVIESISVREAVNFLLFRREFVKQAWGVMRFWPLLCKYVGCMIEFCRIFHVEKPILANLGYLIFKIFWGSMPSDPLEDLGPMVKIENTFILQWDPWPIQTLIGPPPHPCKFWNMAFVALFSSYVLLYVI